MIKIVCLLFIIIVAVVIGSMGINENHISKSPFELDEKGKLKIQEQCKFNGSGFGRDHELGECSVALQIIPKVNNVLEIGGGSGKVSHMINSILQERDLGEKHIVMEPGSSGKGNHGDVHLWKNKDTFKDQYTILKKFACELTMNDLEILDRKPDCLYTDCEGCLLEFCQSEIGDYVLDNVRYIVNEMDGFVKNNQIDKKLRQIWRNKGFEKVGVGYGCGIKCDTEIWKKNNCSYYNDKKYYYY